MNNDAKDRIAALVEIYKKEAASGGIRRYTEEDIKNSFIRPLFEALGWNIGDRNEVSSEEHIKSSGRADYAFYLNGQPKFYVEAKKATVNIHDEALARQAVRYSWNKGVTWAILTNFDRLIVFNAQDVKSSLREKLLFDISYADYLPSLNRLQLLSKEAFSKNEIDEFAEKIGKKYQKIPVSETLYKDLDKCREILTRELAAWNKEKFKNKPHLLDEGVQKLLDRLIFIRVAEDRGIEPPTLLPLVRQWASSKQRNEVPIYKSMVGKFRELDDIYNSDLFKEHAFEDWEEHSGKTEEVIKILRGKEGYYEYDFKVMPADVLGTVYENYLGHKLAQSKPKNTLFKTETVEIVKDARKRKEQGIYYTPAFIVDYIVRNALQPALDKCETIRDLLKIKVLDPACGSGSFLIKALEVLNEKYKQIGAPGDEMTKVSIIMSNLYGVDLDKQAVEIARLNLLINALDRKGKLPFIDNIKWGNSLISGTDAELKKYFGVNFRDKKPFNWEEEFPDVFKQGGFDAVIGNPPYGAELSAGDQNYLKNTYDIGSTDTAVLFIKKSLTNLKKGGSLGFIIPKAFSFASNYKKIRNFVWDDIHTLIDCGKVWNQVKLEQVIVIMRKEVLYKKYQSGVLDDNDQIIPVGTIEKDVARRFGFFLNAVSEEEIAVAQKILKSSLMLNDIVSNERGAMLQKDIGKIGELEVIGGAQIGREGIRGTKGRIDKNKVDDKKAW